MGPLAEQPLQNRYELDQAVRVRTDTETWLGEALNGSMRTSFEYCFGGGELYGEDGGAIGEVFDDAIREARAIVRHNPSLLFELRRRLIEYDEYQDMLKMAGGELGNTMVVVSDYPPELMDNTEDVGGYNARRKQTMLRVITRQQDGSIRMTTQSLEGSNRRALEAVYHQLGEAPQEGELLGQRVHRDLPPEWQARLVDNLTDTYDTSLSEQFGDNWHAGFHQPSERSWLNTYQFARQQADVVEWFTRQKLIDPAGAEKFRFQLAATVNERYERHVRGLGSETQGLQAASESRLYVEMRMAAERAGIMGMVFSGCGASVGAAGSTADSLSLSGYGNRAGRRDKYGSLAFDCPNGHENIREPNELLDHCKTCGCSVRC